MKKTILIIEDDDNIAKAQELILQDKFNIHIENDGEKGLEKAKELKPDLVILDLMLPKLGGIEICKSIRSDEEIKATKIVMVTAKNQQRDEALGINLGADDYIMKPFEADELLHVVHQVLKQ